MGTWSPPGNLPKVMHHEVEAWLVVHEPTAPHLRFEGGCPG